MAAVKGYIELRTCLIEISTLRTSQTNEVQDSVMTINVLNHREYGISEFRVPQLNHLSEERVLPLKLRVKQNPTKMRSTNVSMGMFGNRDRSIQWDCFRCLICLCVLRCVE